MSRSIALIVLMSACCLVATVQAGRWDDEIFNNENLKPMDVYNILMENKMEPMAYKYIIIYNNTSPSICLNEPYTEIYDGRLGWKEETSVSLKLFIEYCEERRKKICKDEVLKAEERLFVDSDEMFSCDLSLEILAYNGDYNAQRILQMVDPERKCEQLDEMRDLAKYPLREGRRSKRVEDFQQYSLKKFEEDCKEYEIVMEDFRMKIETLNKELNQTELSNLENYRQKAFETYLEDVDQNNMIGISNRAADYLAIMHFESKIELPTSCADVVRILGDNNFSEQFKQHNHYYDEEDLPDEYISALEIVPKKLLIRDYELRWIQTYFICRRLIGITRF